MAKIDYVAKYGKKTQKFQEGGAMGAAPAPAEGGAGGGDIMAALQQVVESQDPQMALDFCMALYEAQGGAGAAPAGPEGGAPMARKGVKTSPVFKK